MWNNGDMTRFRLIAGTARPQIVVQIRFRCVNA